MYATHSVICAITTVSKQLGEHTATETLWKRLRIYICTGTTIGGSAKDTKISTSPMVLYALCLRGTTAPRMAHG